jgi:hypothetical protein
MKGGTIIVRIDQNGVPNERFGSILSCYLTELAIDSRYLSCKLSLKSIFCILSNELVTCPY